MKKHVLTAVVAVGCIVLIGACIWYSRIRHDPSYGNGALVAELRGSIRARGASEAARIFSEGLQGLSYAELHNKLHALGQALYIEDGFAGLVECGRFESSGCMHGAMIEARLDQEIPDTQIAALCESGDSNFSRRDCAHGWGHALAYDAYGSITDLNAALKTCGIFGEHKMTQACEYGANMEWFMEMHDSDAPDLNTIGNIHDPLWPCTSIETSYRSACYFALSADGWNVIGLRGHPFSDVAERLRADCDRIVDEKEKESCFNGIGHWLSLRPSFGIRGLHETCVLMTKEPAPQRACIESGIVWKYIHYGTETGDEFCSDAATTEAALCTDVTKLRERPYF